jgi:lysozyme
MSEEMILLPEVVDFIKSEEHCALTAYQDCSPRKIWTVGYGHTGGDVYEGQVIDEEKALEFLEQDLSVVCKQVKHAIQMTLNNYQFSALVSLVFNLGYGNFLKSDVLKLLKAQQIYAAADAFLELDHSDGEEVAGLKTRRERERDMFLTGIGVLQV